MTFMWFFSPHFHCSFLYIFSCTHILRGQTDNKGFGFKTQQMSGEYFTTLLHNTTNTGVFSWTEMVPEPWRTSHPLLPFWTFTDQYRSCPITSLALFHVRPWVSSVLNPLQFAKQTQVGVDHKVIYLLQMAQSHLNCRNTTVRITFFDFLSAFTSIQPFLLREKMRGMQENISMIPGSQTDLNLYWKLLSIWALPAKKHWSTTGKCALLHFLPPVPTFSTGHGGIKGHQGWRETGVQGSNQLLQKMVQEETICLSMWAKPHRWCGPQTATIRSQDAELVNTYRYCGVHLGYKLDFAAVCWVGHSRAEDGRTMVGQWLRHQPKGQEFKPQQCKVATVGSISKVLNPQGTHILTDTTLWPQLPNQK